MALKVTVQEVMTFFNTRSDSGRVVINPPAKMDPLKLHKTEEYNFCCGKAFLTPASLLKHQQEMGDQEHDAKQIDLSKVRLTLADKDNPAFWRIRKTRANKRFNEDGKEVEDKDEEGINEDNDVGDDVDNEDVGNDVDDEEADVDMDEQEGDDHQEEEDSKTEPPKPKSPRRAYKGRSRSKYTMSKRKRKGKIRCDQCEQDIPATNISRHMRTCHTPSHEFPCRYCACRFEVAYGRMVHEVKNHQASLAATAKPTVKTAMKVKKKLIPKPPPPPSSPLKLRVKPEPPVVGGIIDAKQLVPTMTEQQKANCDSHILKLGKNGTDSKGRFQCTICQKTFLGSRNAQDHMNSHYGLKPYKCPLCDFFFSFRSNVVRHIKTCHTENSDFVCPYGCGCSMQSEASLKVHINLICTLRHKYQAMNRKVVVPRAAPVVKAPVFKAPAPPPPSLRAKPNAQLQRVSNPSSSIPTPMDVSSRLGNRVLKEQYLHLEVSPGIYRCEHCNKTITGSGNFRDHLNIHANIKPHKCPRCYMRFTFKSNIKRHLASAHVPGGRLKCPMKCGCTMDNQHALQSHLNKCKTEIVKYRRTQPVASVAPIKIKREVSVSSPSPVSPSKIRASYPPPPPLQKIISRPPPLTPAPTFSSAQYSNADQSSMLASPHTKHQCNVCGKSVSCKRNLTNHMLIHLNIKPCKCLICGLHFRTLDTLKKHKLKSHGSNSSYKCPLCPCKFSQLQGLTMHTNIHHKPKSTKSEASFRSPAKIKYEPQMVIQMKSEDSGHIVTPRVDVAKARTKEGYWKCHVCGKVLKKPLHLQNHMRIHSGEKPHERQLCGHRFRLASTLYDHKKSSHRGGSYKCNLCTCTFETNLGLSRHKGIFHNTQAHDYLQRKIRLIRDKAVKSVFQNRVRPPVNLEDPKHLVPQSGFSAPQKQYADASILKNRLSVHQPPQLVQQLRVGPIASTSAHAFKKPPPMQFAKAAMEKPSTSRAMFQCGHCALALPTLIALSEHQKVHQGMKTTKRLSATTTNESNHDQDVLNVSDPGPSPRSCPICHQAIHGRTHFTKHMSGCHSGGPYRCDFCPCTFDSQGNLSRHHTLMHPNIRHSSNTGNGAAGAAASSFVNSNAESFTDDAEVLYEDDLYEDDQQQEHWDWSQVEASYSNAPDDNSAAAYDVTPEGKPSKFQCPDCDKTFDKLNRYKLHITVHSNVKPYKCVQCRQSFRLPGILATHVKKSHGSGQFRCKLCPSRFTSAKGLSVHEFVYHKGGRLERAVGRTQVVNTVVKKPIPIIPATASASQLYSNSPSSTSRFCSTMRAPLTKHTVMVSNSNPRPVKLKCHICAQIFFGTTSLKEHMKEHSGQPRSFPTRGIQTLPPVARNSTRTQNVYSQVSQPLRHFNNGQAQRQYSSPDTNFEANGENSSFQEMYEEDDDQGTFEIVGYENGYENGGAEMEEDPEIEYQDEDEEEQLEEYYEEDNYDYINADDHLEIVHEDSNFTYDADENDETYGVEDEMDDDDSQEDQGWTYNNQAVQPNDDTEESQTIYCKGCQDSFETRDAFAYHVENNPTSGTHRCSYCCTQGLTLQNLSDHIDHIHPMDEIEFIESQVYNYS